MNKLKRIYHIADVHIRNVKRHKEYREVFNKMFYEIRKRGTEDSIIYLAGDIAHAKLEMSPELVSEIVWLFKTCAEHCPTILITGNHDCNMNNSDRLDVLTPIVDALDLPNFHYLRDTQIRTIDNVDFAVFSIFDNKDNWPKADTLAGRTKIALFHGPVDNSQTDIGYVVSSRHFTTDIFDGYDLALLGDIHKRQELVSPKGCKAVYAGSLIQQNFGESLDKHGLLVWDLDTLTYEEVDIPNDYGYYTLDVNSGVVPNVNDMPKHPRLRVRLSNTDTADTKRAIAEIKMRYGVDDFTIIRTDTLSKLKTGNRNTKLDFENIADINYQNSLISDYIGRMMPFVSTEDITAIQAINEDINSRITHDDVQRNIHWKPVTFTFSNMFSYGEDNKIDFTKVGGLMGLFAPNASGKSSLFDAISFCLYDKCSRAFKAQNILNNRKTTFYCQLDFQINGIDYHIRREAKTINKGKNVKVDVQFWKTEGDQSVSLNGTERRDTNAIIEQYVGTYEDFILTALSLQGNNALFIDKSQSERKDLLAQFMGLNVFDKLYETATEDIREVSVLVKNFKRTDFTSELAKKAAELKQKRKELTDKESELSEMNTTQDSIINQILKATKLLIPIDSKLDINELESKKTKIESDINYLQSDRDVTIKKIDEYKSTIQELSNLIEDKKFINGKSIEIAKIEWDEYKRNISDTEHRIELLTQSINSNKEKLAHLEAHEYDPNCKFCMNNVFVKDAIATKELVEKQETELDELIKQRQSLIQQASHIAEVEDQWDELVELKLKYQKSIVIKEKAEAELRSVNSKEELYIHQLEKIESDIQKYLDNEDAIKQNLSIESDIECYNGKKSSIESSIRTINKDIQSINGVVGSLESFIEEIKRKMIEVKELEEKARLYTYYLDAVKRDGIPYELISKALPVIETEVNNILGQVVDFGLVMEVDGKNINAKIVYDDQHWPLEMCSGMEKFISGLAIRVALINICNLPRPNFLVIDEGFGTLDSDNLSSLFMMMQYLKTQFDFIWVISHLEQMRDIVDGLIEIKKINGFSRIDF
ncbi:AAA domain containing protein [uncultured Caudovirales phage]|uniref:AAA domain containing protein n=1 Tax=uncultured Caudovirales phage TaxID=2100421 RepID=A0A6J5M7Y8_9CAUD|nr:AAA domain containing protein [uncultured Caudovirales phage]